MRDQVLMELLLGDLLLQPREGQADHVAGGHGQAVELFALGRLATSEQTIATTWSVSLRRLHAGAPAAEDVLSLCAFLAPDDIPRSLLEEHTDLLPEPLAGAVHDRLAFRQAIGVLRRYSLVGVDGDALRLHRLVQAVIRHRLNSEQATVSASAAVRLVAAAFPDRAEYVETWPSAARLLPRR